MGLVTVFQMADPAINQVNGESSPLKWSGHISLTSRILAVNILPLALLGGGIFYLDTYRTQLLTERYKLARIEAQITAEALAGASRQRQEALLVQIGKEQQMRLRMYDAEGRLWADSFTLDEPPFAFNDPVDDTFDEDFARVLDEAVDAIVGAEKIPFYVEPELPGVEGWPELLRAREEGLSQIELRQAADGTPVINVAAPVGLRGSTLLTTRNAVDITEKVRAARSTLGIAVMVALLASVLLSLFLARTIVLPLRMLASSAVRVRQGRERAVQVPRLPERNDEIGLLARAVSDMTSALRHRIDAVDSFAADVAHEIKNPLSSLRNAIESLPRVEDPALRKELTEIAAHDVRRIDRLVSEISDASRVEAEISRATLERVDLAEMAKAIVGSREDRHENQGREIVIISNVENPTVTGVAARLERVVENLLDNAVSFSPPDAPISVIIEKSGQMISLEVCDQGPGIPEDSREKVFQRFHSIRPDSEAFGNHSGLGLAIARSIAEAHDGTLTAHAREDGKQGACLRLRLPKAAV
jgi:two-component system sensor histidine kinase ChvG